MKQLGLISILLMSGLFIAQAQSNTQKMAELFTGVIDFSESEINETRPIPSVCKIAMQQADTVYSLTKENIKTVMAEAKKYQYCAVAVETYTVVLVKSWSDCSQSGSWNYCMPKGEGYIQSGELIKKDDYLNNIIGTQSGKRRSVFLFNKK